MSFDPLKSAKATLAKERKGLQQLEASLGEDFSKAIDILSHASGRVIVSGIGKSGHVGRKIAATLASTGTPAQFVHPAEASHGDLGMITPQDVILAMSWSGETNELANLIAYAARFDIALIAMTSKRNSLLGRTAKVCLTLPVAEEACPNGLAPTTSTTMQLALGDAIAIALLQKKNFTAADFKNFHPGGKLGANLTLVEDIMHSGDALPLIGEDVIMSEAIVEMTRKGFGCLGVINKKGHLIGIITDGDLRRHMSSNLLEMTTGAIMTHSPMTAPPAILAAEALKIMNSASIQCVFICKSKKPVGLVRILDLLRIGTA